MTKRLKAVFMGTPQIAVDVLDELVKHHDVICVYTKEPAPAKRGKQLLNSPVHNKALELGIEVRHPKTLKTQDAQDEFTALDADISVVCAYGHILPDSILNAFEFQSINVHVSMLPKYRGAAPIERAVINGDKSTGITIMKIVQQLDAGDILQQQEIEIPETMNVQELYQEIGTKGSKLCIDTIAKMISGDIKPIKQDENLVTFAPKILKEEFKINFNKPAKEIHNLIRGIYPYAYFEHKEERIGVTQSWYENGNFGEAGQFINGGREVVCKDGKLILKRLKRAGKKEMSIEDFLRGYSFEV